MSLLVKIIWVPTRAILHASCWLLVIYACLNAFSLHFMFGLILSPLMVLVMGIFSMLWHFERKERKEKAARLTRAKA